MATGSGLDAQLGLVTESGWGTATTVTRFVEFNNETVKLTPTFLEPTGLRVGTKYKRASRVRIARHSVGGDFEVEHATKGMGLLWAHALASGVTATTQIGTTTAYKQIHTPGAFFGLGMTLQIGRPQPSDGVVKPFTYSGCKVTDWMFDLKDNAIPTLKLTVDGKTEDTATALASASYLSGTTVFDFSQATIKLGGTVSTTGGETTVSGGVAMTTVVHEYSLTGKAPMDTARFGIGNAGAKNQQLENAVPTLTGKLTAEFNKAELYDVFTAGTTTAMEFDLTGAAIGSSGNNYLLTLILPAVKLKAAPPNVAGPAIVSMATDFEVYSNETDPVIQVKIVSDESTTV